MLLALLLLLTSAASLSTPSAPTPWELFTTHHAPPPSTAYTGVTRQFSFIGECTSSTPTLLCYEHSELGPTQGPSVRASNTVSTQTTSSPCPTCFDSSSSRTFPLGSLTPSSLSLPPFKAGSVGLVAGPRVLRSGRMAIELALAHEDARARVTFTLAPAWPAGKEEVGLPAGLKLCSASLVTEAQRDGFGEEHELDLPPSSPRFLSPVPPYAWHRKWSGSSWTWGPEGGDKGWSIPDLDEADAWHGRPRGDGPGVWNLRLPGILLQCPSLLPLESTGSALDSLFRLAWLATPEKLLRLEAGVLIPESEDDQAVGKPVLASFRCDTLNDMGELDGASLIEREKRGEEGVFFATQ